MKRILLTSTALVMAAGVASAETSINWSATANAGVARTGKVDAVAAKMSATMTVAQAAAIADTNDSLGSVAIAATTSGNNVNGIVDAVDFQNTVLHAIDTLGASSINVSAPTARGVATATNVAAETVAMRQEINELRAAQVVLLASAANAAQTTVIQDKIDIADKMTAYINQIGSIGATTAVATGEFDTYSEINATVTGTVTMDNGMTLSAGMSVDAGKGYNFADDEGFDATKTNGVAFDSITLNAGEMGVITFDENDVAHLVDGDDETNGDISYTNTFGSIAVSAVMDIDKDTDLVAKKVAVATTAYAVGTEDAIQTTITGDAAGVLTFTEEVAAVAADVAWSAKISMPVAGGTAYVAMDEEGGNIFGASTVLSGITLSFDSKLEALEEELSIDRSNTIGVEYTMGALKSKATWNSDEDGDQWGLTATYAADGVGFTAYTDEGSDWNITGSVDLGASGAKVVGGVNYTEDAYLGLSFAF